MAALGSELVSAFRSLSSPGIFGVCHLPEEPAFMHRLLVHLHE